MRITTLTLQTITQTATGAVELTFAPRRPLAYRAGQAGLLRVAVVAAPSRSPSPPTTAAG